MTKIKLFCLPYAGATAMVYSKWKKHLADYIELCEVELPGRGRRIAEPFCNSVDEVMEDAVKQLKDKISDNCRYALFGHSMGSILVYELAYKIKELVGFEPVHIFFSGRSSPDVKEEDVIVHTLPDDEFKNQIAKFGDTIESVFENEELSRIFLPILRADYKLIDTYIYSSKCSKLDCNFTVLYGTDDTSIISDIKSWSQFTNKQCCYVSFNGGHFFINTHMEDTIKIINDTLGTYINSEN